MGRSMGSALMEAGYAGDLTKTFGERWGRMVEEFLLGVGIQLATYLSDTGYSPDTPEVHGGALFLTFEGDQSTLALRGQFHVWIGLDENRFFPQLDITVNERSGRTRASGDQKVKAPVYGGKIVGYSPKRAAQWLLAEGGLGEALGIYDL